MDLLQIILIVPSVLLLLITGLYLSIRLKWVQLFKLPKAFSVIFDNNSGSKFSSMMAFLTIVGGNLGVGNISGTAVALKHGGPGFILWMLIIITITTSIKYATCYLSLGGRVRIDGKYVGGPMSYFTEAFKSKQMPLIFLIIMVICALTVGNLVQSNSLSIPMHLIGVSPLFLGTIMALLFFATTTLNISKIVNIILSIVPLMTLSYLLLSVVVLYKFRDNILPSLLLIAENFMSFECFKLGLFGSFILETFAIIKVATFRGIFATDIGLGLEGIVHSSIEHRKNDHNFRVTQSLISMISPFVVMIITFITTMVLLVTDVWHGELESTNMCIQAFITAFNSKIVYYILVCIMFCFSFTTVFTWFFCTQSVIRYVLKKDYYVKIWSIVFALVIPIGSVMQVSLLWQIADLAVAIMILINTTAIIMMIPKNRLMFDYSEINNH